LEGVFSLVNAEGTQI